MLAGAFVCASLLRAVAGATGVTYDLGVTTDGRVRTIDVSGFGLERGEELEIDPTAVITVAGPTLDLVLSYRPLLAFSTLPGEGQALLHQGAAVSHWQVDPRWKATLQLGAAHGTVNVFELPQPAAAQPGTAPPPAQTVPVVPTLETERLQATLALQGAPAPRLHLDAAIDGLVGGGATPAARTYLPLQRSVDGAAGVGWDASRADLVTTRLSATATSFSTGQAIAYVVVAEEWRRTFSPKFFAVLSAGGAAAGQLAPPPASWAVLPTGRAAVDATTVTGDLSLHGSVELTAAPYGDPVFGVVAEQVGAGLIGDAAVGDRWTLQVNGTFGYVATSVERGATIVTGLAKLVRHVGPALDLGVGAQGIFERQPAFASRFSDWNVFVELAARTRGAL